MAITSNQRSWLLTLGRRFAALVITPTEPKARRLALDLALTAAPQLIEGSSLQRDSSSDAGTVRRYR
jgi:hypothetical protein